MAHLHCGPALSFFEGQVTIKLAILQVADTIYKDVPGYPLYQVGSDGSVWSCALNGPRKGEKRGRYMKLSPRADKDGYPRVTLCRDGKASAPLGVHYLVLLAFVGPRPDGLQACHGDGNPSNCRLSNLRWGTPSENNLDKRNHGTDQSGERNGNRKLSAEDVREIKEHSREFGSQIRLARKFGVHRDTIRKIWSGRIRAKW